MQLKLLAPDGINVWAAEVSDTALVFNGQQYVKPFHARYAEVQLPWVEAATPEWQEGSKALSARQSLLLKVIECNETEPVPFPVNVVDDPSDGECICMLTCFGPKLAWVQVTPWPPLPPFVPPEVVPNPGAMTGCVDTDSCCDCNVKPCCSPRPDLATHIRCEPSGNPYLFWY